jgi:cephalosporin hydroxylase
MPKIKKLDIKSAGEAVIDLFHRLYYDNSEKTWGNTFYLGIRTYKLPLDLWIYQELIYKIKPDVVIETGTFRGGSALYMADICDAIGKGLVITIDNMSYKQNVDKKALHHKRIRFIKGSSISKKTLSIVKKFINPHGKIMVILDSSHKKNHVLNELKIYSKLVSRGSYLIIEDTNINGHPAYKEFGPGPMEAVEEFLKRNKNFISDRKMEKFYFTFNPKGYLLRIK